MTVLSSVSSVSLAATESSAPLVKSFAEQEHVATPLPPAQGDFKAEILDAKIKDQDVIRLTRKAAAAKGVQLVGVDVVRGAGLATIAWRVQLPDGRTFNLTGAAPAKELQKSYEAAAQNPYRDNLFFQSGAVASLYPLTNRLTGPTSDHKILHAKVDGLEVAMPLNNIAKIKDAIPHHLHGLLYGQFASEPHDAPMVSVTNQGASVSGEFEVGAPWWTGQTQVTTTSELSARGYTFHMKVQNIGKTAVPVGAGAHPYFMSPDASPESILVHVPAKATAEINNLSDVLPTGKIIRLKEADPALDFTNPKGTPLFAHAIKNNATDSRLDNLWLDLEKDKDGYAYVEALFPLSHFKVRMTALTKNVIGIQGYAPKPTAAHNPFIALELVTNLPDPRKELWGTQSTGMTVLKPGETFEYGYRVELSPL